MPAFETYDELTENFFELLIPIIFPTLIRKLA